MKNDFVIDIEKEEIDEKAVKTSKILRIISFILAIIPILLIGYCVIASHGEGEDGAGAVMWLVILYYWTIGLPIAAGSIITGIVSYIKQKNVFSIISLILAALPFIAYVLMFLKSFIASI